ncbi:MAG: hypothetical protein NZ908_01330 [Candidatus Micrarchaeota archaeon]|nr:hypothetical protein [Candidatus Micrarchaeota archaeon]MCX8154361.1 hypothetical protein [Candidatus Micrarchaeota archaeon]
MRELKIIEPYRPFLLLEVASMMAEHNINIASIRSLNLGEIAIISLMLDDQDFQRAMNIAVERWNVVKADSIIVELQDRPGELAKMVKLLSSYNIEIRESNVVDRKNTKTYLMINTTNNTLAKRILEKDYNVS